MKKKTNLGFTLIELMVVITIIAILATMGINTFTAAQKKARDAKRQSDVRTLVSCAASTADINGNITAAAVGDDAMTAACPNHPEEGPAGTTYHMTIDDNAICVCAELEVEGTGNASDEDGCIDADGAYATPTECTSGDCGYFCIGM